MKRPPERLFEHVYGGLEGILATFTATQARFYDPQAPQNKLAKVSHRFFTYPAEAPAAATHLLEEAMRRRDCYFGAHLYRARRRLASNAVPQVRALWLDEDDGWLPDDAPEPTAIVASSASRRQLFWALTQAVSVEWAVTMNRRLAVLANGDTSKAGLSSVLRAPGTRNYKRHPRVDLVTMVTTGTRSWAPPALEAALPEIVETEAPISPKGASPQRNGARGQLRRSPYDGPAVELDDYLAVVEVIGEAPDDQGVKFQVVCPWVDEHSGGDDSGTYLGMIDGGGLYFACHHAHCYGRAWADFRARVALEVKRANLIKRGVYW